MILTYTIGISNVHERIYGYFKEIRSQEKITRTEQENSGLLIAQRECLEVRNTSTESEKIF